MKNIIIVPILVLALTFNQVVTFATVETATQTQIAEISAKAYVLMEASTGEVILAKNEHEQLSMASTTKIMSALLTLEQEDLNLAFEVDSQAIQVEGSSMGLQEGDIVDLYTLAVGQLLPSGNDASNAAAVRISGSLPEFAMLMNERASAIGMVDTNFVTPSGLDDEYHYSTAYDMALLAREAMLNPVFAEICKQTEIIVSFGNPPYNRTLSNHNKLLEWYDGAIGMKTGYTRKSGRCLVSVAERNGVQLICVTLNDPDDWQDHEVLLNYGFANTNPVEIKASVDKLTANVVGGVENVVIVETMGEAFSCVELEKLEEEIILSEFYYAPIKIGDVLGEIRHIYNGRVIATTSLIASETIELQEHVSFFKKMMQWFK